MKIFTYIKNDSFRVKRKNFRKLDDLELWKHLILELSDFDVFIDTDSDDVLRDCEQYSHVTAYSRDQKFIDMENNPKNKLSPALLMTENFLDNHVSNEEIVVVTHVTSPFLKKETILKAISYLDDGYEFVHSVHSIQDFAWMGKNFKPLNFNPSVVQRTQDLEKIHFSNGAFFIFRKSSFKKHKNRIGPNTFYFPLNHIESIEIDNENDLNLAKIVYKGLNA